MGSPNRKFCGSGVGSRARGTSVPKVDGTVDATVTLRVTGMSQDCWWALGLTKVDVTVEGDLAVKLKSPGLMQLMLP